MANAPVSFSPVKASIPPTRPCATCPGWMACAQVSRCSRSLRSTTISVFGTTQLDFFFFCRAASSSSDVSSSVGGYPHHLVFVSAERRDHGKVSFQEPSGCAGRGGPAARLPLAAARGSSWILCWSSCRTRSSVRKGDVVAPRSSTTSATGADRPNRSYFASYNPSC